MKDIRQSIKKRVRRSQINLNPYNPKNHTEEQIKKQLQNIRKVGYLGGIAWNETTGNLIDGHRRIFALDLYYKYDGTNDYDVEVEAVEFDEKTEKEQMTYMAIANSKADLSVIATYIDDTDLKGIGVDEATINEILTFKEDNTEVEIPTFTDLFDLPDKTASIFEESSQEKDEDYEARKQAVKEAKQSQKQEARERSQDLRSYVVLSFDDSDAKADMLQYFGYDPTETIIKGEEFIQKLQEQ